MNITQSFSDDVGTRMQVELDNQGYANATRMCTSSGKSWSNYRKTQNTEKFLTALATMLDLKIDGCPPIGRDLVANVRDPSTVPRYSSILVQVTNGPNEARGTWVHQKVAIHLAQWISPVFQVWVTDLVEKFVQGQLMPTSKPIFIESCLGTADWRASQVYFAGTVHGSFSGLKRVGTAEQVDPSIIVGKFGKQTSGDRFVTHQREFGSWRLLDSLLTNIPDEAERKVKDYLRLTGRLAEGKHCNKQTRDVELFLVSDQEDYNCVIRACSDIVEKEMITNKRDSADLQLLLAQERTKQLDIEAKRDFEREKTKQLEIEHETTRLRLRLEHQNLTDTAEFAPPTKAFKTEPNQRKTTSRPTGIHQYVASVDGLVEYKRFDSMDACRSLITGGVKRVRVSLMSNGTRSVDGYFFHRVAYGVPFTAETRAKGHYVKH